MMPGVLSRTIFWHPIPSSAYRSLAAHGYPKDRLCKRDDCMKTFAKSPFYRITLDELFCAALKDLGNQLELSALSPYDTDRFARHVMQYVSWGEDRCAAEFAMRALATP